MTVPKTPSGYKLFARAWGYRNRDHDKEVLRNHGYTVKVIKRREAPDPRRPTAKMDRYYIYGRK